MLPGQALVEGENDSGDESRVGGGIDAELAEQMGGGLDVVGPLLAFVAGEVLSGGRMAEREQTELVMEHHPSQHLVVGARGAPRRAPQRGDKARRVTGLLHRSSDIDAAALEAAVEDGDEQIGLVSEVRIHGASGEAGGLGDAVEAGAAESLGHERVFGGVEHPRSGLRLGFGS